MAPLAKSSSTALQACARQRLPAVRPTALAVQQQQRRRKADARASFESPFASAGAHDTNKIPDFSKYMSRRGETSNRVLQYFMVGAMGAITAAGAKSTVNGKERGSRLTGLTRGQGCYCFESMEWLM